MRHPRPKGGRKDRDDQLIQSLKSFIGLETHFDHRTALVLLIAARLFSALFNIIHDCDEVYNYWEPLHYLVYGHGMQTWEYSSKFALRAWLYIVAHAAIAWPAAWVFGSAAGKVIVFYLIKTALSMISAWTEWQLYSVVRNKYPPFIANALLIILVVSSGMFTAASALLPSSFAMYALTAAAAGVLQGNYHVTIICAVVGVTLGWSVASVAFVPYALWVLLYCPFLPALGTALLALAATTIPMAVVDKLFYGKWTASLLNFLIYNVAGGGQSSLYGVEPPLYYLRNGLNQLQLVMPLALLLPITAGIRYKSWRSSVQMQTRSKLKGVKPPVDGALIWAVAPAFFWLAAISSLPHKEERFLYVVYPLLCLAAATSLHCLVDIGSKMLSIVLGKSSIVKPLVKMAALLVLVFTSALSVSRSMALITHYGAPMAIFRHLPSLDHSSSSSNRSSGLPSNNATLPVVTVCLGAEWYRFPSAFFLPGPQYRLQFIKSGFTGLLPRPFDDAQGGTAAAPLQLNDGNIEDPDNYWESADTCDYAVTLEDKGKYIDDVISAAVEKSGKWRTVAELPFVDNARSPTISRALYLPWREDNNYKMKYKLLAREN